MFTTTNMQHTPASMTPRHMRGRVSSRTLVAGKWVRTETEQARLSVFGRDAVNAVNQASAVARYKATLADWARVLR